MTTTLHLLEKERGKLIHLELVSRTIYALIPLCEDREKTESYLNLYLFADMRFHAGNNAPLRENEVDPSLAGAVRLEVLHMIRGDEMFIYAWEMITQNNHMYQTPADCSNLVWDPAELAITRELETWQRLVDQIREAIVEKHMLMKLKVLTDFLTKELYNGDESRMAAEEGEVGEEPVDGPKGSAFTLSQVILCFYYICQEQDINYENSHKTNWARCIARISGKSEQRIRNSLNFDLHSKKSRRDLMIIHPVMSKLFPAIGEKILMDMKI